MRRLALIALFALAASACTLDVNVGISLGESGSGTATVDIVADDEFHQLYRLTGREFEDLIASRGEEIGLTFEVTPGATTRYSAVTRVVSTDTLIGILEGLAPGIGDITISPSTDELVFDGSLSPLTNLDDVAPYFADSDPGQFAEDVSVTVQMVIPGEVSSSTGTSTGPGKLTWSVPFSNSATRVLARSSLVGDGSGIPWNAVVLIGTLVFAFGFLVAVRSRLTSDEEAATTPRSFPEVRSTAPEDQPVSTDQTPPEDQPVEPPGTPYSD